MRLIDADALMHVLVLQTGEHSMCTRDGECWVEFADVERIVKEQSTIEPDRSLWFRIGETCVDESKGFISSGRAVEKIRELLREAGRTIERRPK